MNSAIDWYAQGMTEIKALYINCSIKYDNKTSHTQKLINRSAGILRSQGVNTETIHALDYDIAFGMEKDLSKVSDRKDEWPLIQEKIMEADILVLGTPIWLGVKASVATLVIERMYAYSGDRNNKGQYLYYGKTAGCIITGNEDGAKACAMDMLYAMSHIGYAVPPQADCAWLGEAGPGPSYSDTQWGDETLEAPAGYNNNFTNRNTTIMSWNLMHMANLLKQNNGFPSEGNVADNWQDFANATQQDPDERIRSIAAPI